MQPSGIILAYLVEGHPRKISVKKKLKIGLLASE